MSARETERRPPRRGFTSAKAGDNGQMSNLLRLSRILAGDDRTVIVALDRPRALYTPTLAEPGGLVTACRQGGADAVIVGAGTLQKCARHLRGLGVILAIGPAHGRAQRVVDLALRLGADSVKAEVFPFDDRHQEAVGQLEELGMACTESSMPLLAEVVPGGFDAISMHTSTNIATGARIAAEMGADIVKVPWPSEGTLEEVVSYATIPVVILGGPTSGRAAMSNRAASAAKAGAAGVAVGRNVFEDSDPVAAIAELRDAVHGDIL